ncbi:hypothetical protein [Acidovorax sp.]|uniref:hypothetical protein n=1 Tax=Acidovorax sp. TaxID=1872122 RepID=UPI002589F1F9|nr:hypothetical protein [Acidovorax sp.]
MRDYGKVYSTFWSSGTVTPLSDDGKLLALYLMTCHHATITGVFRMPDGYVSEDLGWDIERVRQGFAQLLANGFANRCETTKWVWITKHLTWNPPENPNQRKAAAKVALSIPDECSWKPAFMRVCGPLLGLEVEQNANPSGTVVEPFLNQEQEQKTGTEAGTGLQTHTPLASDWALPKAWGDWATAEFAHWTPEVIRSIAAQFADHQRSKSAESADWCATWRKWCRDDLTQKAHPAPKAKPADRVAQPVGITVPCTDKRADEFAASMESRKSTATLPVWSKKAAA